MRFSRASSDSLQFIIHSTHSFHVEVVSTFSLKFPMNVRNKERIGLRKIAPMRVVFDMKNKTLKKILFFSDFLRILELGACLLALSRPSLGCEATSFLFLNRYLLLPATLPHAHLKLAH